LARLLPFKAVHYRERDLSELIAPPYDILPPDEATVLLNQNPKNIAAVDTSAGGSYEHRGAVLQTWMANRILVEDDAPSFTVVAHEFIDPSGHPQRRVGLIGRIRVDDEIRVHESTHHAPKADRLELLRATRFHLSPIFLLRKGVPIQLDPVIAREPDSLASLSDERIEAWRLSEHDQVTYVMELFADCDLYVADGHHRLATAKLWAEERFAQEHELAADAWFIPAYVCDANDAALYLLPTHRLVKRQGAVPRSIGEIRKRLSQIATTSIRPCTREEALQELGRVDPALCGFAICCQDGAAFVTVPRPSGLVASLDVEVLDGLILPALGVDNSTREESLRYTRDIDEVVASEDVALAIACNPCSVEDVLAVADAGEVMPQKSTYFYPKVPTGLALARA
jgi:uncharacterized protein (DUF1015 family)